MVDRYNKLENITQKLIFKHLKPTLSFKGVNEGFLDIRLDYRPNNRMLFEDVAGRPRTAKNRAVKNEFVMYNPDNKKKLVRIECKSQEKNSDLTHRIYKLLGDVKSLGLDEDCLYIVLGGYLATNEFKNVLRNWIDEFLVKDKVMFGDIEKFEKFLIKYSK